MSRYWARLQSLRPGVARNRCRWVSLTIATTPDLYSARALSLFRDSSSTRRVPTLCMRRSPCRDASVAIEGKRIQCLIKPCVRGINTKGHPEAWRRKPKPRQQNSLNNHPPHAEALGLQWQQEGYNAPVDVRSFVKTICLSRHPRHPKKIHQTQAKSFHLGCRGRQWSGGEEYNYPIDYTSSSVGRELSPTTVVQQHLEIAYVTYWCTQ